MYIRFLHDSDTQKLTRMFELCNQDEFASTLLCKVEGDKGIGRMLTVSLTGMEALRLRMLLYYIRDQYHFSLRSVEGVLHGSIA